MKFEVEGEMPKPGRFLTPEEYGFVYGRSVRLCFDFVVKRDGKILLAKRTQGKRKGCWSLSGGTRHWKESILACATRLLMDEFGLVPKKMQDIGFIDFPDEGEFHSTSIVFLTTVEPGEPRVSDQASELMWVDALPTENLHPEHGSFLKEKWNTIISQY